ncbi:uncharacterized protein LOC105438691 [Strongylocentrotus purpuratus]|uniref:Netrin module non-TIMP type domain-containing protein n=1 Tax=Strongylocentrotus purpuratus TaxID=7668 RepID=A0A7M7HDB9_STRPU|nr:uncharacterized protein LOC105438691 [Strongylocentrotus purpuratus]
MSGLAIFLVALMIGSSQACRCIFQPLGQKYCDSKFAILANVTQVQEPSISNDYIWTYTLEVGAIFRDEEGDITLGNGATVKSYSDSCRVFLQQGHTYILTGGRQGLGDLWLHDCSAIFLDITSSSPQEEIVLLVLSVPEPCPYLTSP